MNLAQLIQYINNIAIEHPLVKTFVEGDVYQLNSKEVKYGVFCLTQPQNNVVKVENVKRYTFTAFYIDRLTEDESNKLVVQTDGINAIHEIFNYIKTNSQTANVNLPITFTTFTEKFADKCAGAYANVIVEVDDETGDCDFYYEDILVEPIPGTSHTTVLDNYYTKVEVEDLIRDATHDADMVDYDNTLTGLPATTAQDAIDQLYVIAMNDPAFKAWLDTNAIYLAVLLDEQPINPENKYLNALRQWIEIAIGSSGYEAPLYYTSIDSATHIIGSTTLFYKKISYQPELAETSLQKQSKDNVRTLVGTYLYDSQIETTTIDSGNFGFKLRCKINTAQGTNVLEYVPFLYHIDGTRTDLFTCVSDPLTNTVYLDNYKQYPSNTIHCLETDRLGVDVYFKSSSNALKTLDVLIGDGHASYMVTPLRLRHDALRDLNGNPNFLHITQEQKNKLINNYTYKILNTSVSNWVASNTYSGYLFQATINISNLIEGDFVDVLFNSSEAISGNYLPVHQQHNGYIIIYSKVNTTITIPTIVVTKILL